MKQRTLIFLLLKFVMTASQFSDSLFEMPNERPSIKEGSCVELTVTAKRDLPVQLSNWAWMKDAIWSTSRMEFIGSVLLSSDQERRPVHPYFVGRAKSVGSPPSLWSGGTSMTILMCDVMQSDNGYYQFIYELKAGEDSQWGELSVYITVKENICPVYMVNQRTTWENNVIILTCATPRSCLTLPEFGGDNLPVPLGHEHYDGKIATIQFVASWDHDGMEIFCQIKGNTDKYLRKYFTLHVKYATKNTQVNFPEGISFIREGDNMTLICNTNGNPTPTLEWFENDQVLPVVAPQLTIPSVTVDHNGKYKCVATNMYKTEEATFDVDIKYPPTVEVKSSQPGFTEGEAMTLTCNVTRGNPSPDLFKWFKDDIYLRSGEVYQVSSVQAEHRGWYTCVASSYVGSGQHRFLIQVNYHPRETRISVVGSDSPMVVAGTSVRLQCLTDANPEPNNYTWWSIVDGSTSEFLGGRWTLLPDIQPGDQTCYMCRATNWVGIGDNSDLFCIQVLYGPTNLLLSLPTEVTEGTLVSVFCSVDSLPFSTLTLTRTPRDQSSVVSVATSAGEEVTSNTLTYSFKATSATGGIYACEASNSQGTQSTQKILEVNYPPKNVMVKAFPSLVVSENEYLTLECVADSNPPTDMVTWWKAINSTQKILAEGRTLNVAAADVGFYGCTAGNNLGLARSPEVEVKIQTPPIGSGKEWILLYIIPALVVLLVMAIVFAVFRKMKSNRPRHQDSHSQTSVNVFVDLPTCRSGVQKTATKHVDNISTTPSAGSVEQNMLTFRSADQVHFERQQTRETTVDNDEENAILWFSI
ncbi:hemicentin-1-like isoform X2 [Corythoichthys intestinalis]|uniref:hemicentin-1-like isoform X2 n=1 Tax=Corythoichthys intestinalis TaxID=161448 RepID=UPI0025A4DBDC|nr:hemicentin-1-like isoform X2 [Corythoichthys intestinalis]